MSLTSPIPSPSPCARAQIVCCLVGGVFAGIRIAGSDVENMKFIWGDAEPQSPLLVTFLKFWSFIIIFTNFVPISLLVTLDMVKMFQSRLIGWDIEMCHEAREFSGATRIMRAEVRGRQTEEDGESGVLEGRGGGR